MENIQLPSIADADESTNSMRLKIGIPSTYRTFTFNAHP